MPENAGNPLSFWLELKRRKVVRVITVYAAAAFVILELVDILSPSLGLPTWTLNFILVLLCVGFILAVILSWIYDITPEGIEKTKPIHKVSEEDKPVSSKGWKITSYISFVVIIALLVLNIIPRTHLSGKRATLEKSIAVIPFIDDSPNKNNEHIINGIMEDLLINLQSIKDLRVPGRTSIEQYRNNPKPIPDIATELGVNYIVEGSGQKYGNHYTLRVQLLEGATGMHIWGHKFEQDIESMEDIVNFISAISRSIAEELEAIISPDEKLLIEKIPTTDLTAYDFYLQGREEYEKYRLDVQKIETLERAEDRYNISLDYDSSFALAYAGLAWIYWSKYSGDWETYLSEDYLDSAMILADFALSYDNQLSEAYLLRGAYYQLHDNKEQAINEYDKAIKFNPNEWRVYWRKADLYVPYIDLAKAIDNIHRAIELHRGSNLPGLLRDLGTWYTCAGFKEKGIYFASEALRLDNDSAEYYQSLQGMEGIVANFENSIIFGEKSYAIDSTDRWVIWLLAMDHCFLGQNEKCLDYYKKLEKGTNFLDKSEFATIFKIGHAYWLNGFEKEAEFYFNKGLELYDKVLELDRGPNVVVPYYLATYYAFRGERDKAYENLRLFNQVPRMPYYSVKDLRYEPLFDSIRDEPEFQQILKDVEAKFQIQHEEVKQWLEENDML